MLNKEKGRTRDHKDQRKTTLQPAGIVKRLPKKGLIMIGCPHLLVSKRLFTRNAIYFIALLIIRGHKS